jgi:hypothetical protein
MGERNFCADEEACDGKECPLRRYSDEFLSVLDEFAQPAEGVVPLLRNQVEIMARIFESALFQLPNALAPVSSAMHETRFLHYPQVFSDRLAGDLRACGEPGDRHWPVVTEPEDKP